MPKRGLKSKQPWNADNPRNQKMLFALNIAKLREDAGYSLQKASSIIRCSTRYLYEYENGQRLPTLLIMQRMSGTYNVPLETMVSWFKPIKPQDEAGMVYSFISPQYENLADEKKEILNHFIRFLIEMDIYDKSNLDKSNLDPSNLEEPFNPEGPSEPKSSSDDRELE